MNNTPETQPDYWALLEKKNQQALDWAKAGNAEAIATLNAELAEVETEFNKVQGRIDRLKSLLRTPAEMPARGTQVLARPAENILQDDGTLLPGPHNAIIVEPNFGYRIMLAAEGPGQIGFGAKRLAYAEGTILEFVSDGPIPSITRPAPLIGGQIAIRQTDMALNHRARLSRLKKDNPESLASLTIRWSQDMIWPVRGIQGRVLSVDSVCRAYTWATALTIVSLEGVESYMAQRPSGPVIEPHRGMSESYFALHEIFVPVEPDMKAAGHKATRK